MELKERFFNAVSPLKYFLLLLGIEWNPSRFKILRILIIFWCIIWLVTVVAICSMYTERLSEPEIINLFYSGTKEPAIDSLMRCVDRVNKSVCSILTYLLVFFCLVKVFRGFIEKLEKIDITLRRPSLSGFKPFSICAVVWMVLTVSFLHTPY